MLMILATPPGQPQGGLIFPEENGVCCVMLAGANKDYPPAGEAGFVDFARSLGTEFHRAVQAAEPLTQAYGYRGTESRRRHDEKLTRWPDRYVVLGDAFYGFNPIYGQGMTVAAMSAVALGDEIRRTGGDLDGLAQRTQGKISAIIAHRQLVPINTPSGMVHARARISATRTHKKVAPTLTPISIHCAAETCSSIFPAR
jgi:flavin-dependent dehydrogenase